MKWWRQNWSNPRLILLLLVLVGLLLRWYQLGNLPASLNRDEAALAYNAFLLKTTGQDEWGRKWPIALESFGDYKLVGYVLAEVITFTAIGVNDWTVRLPSMLAGATLIGLTYLIVRRRFELSSRTSLWIAAFVALQPIFFFYSRIAFEANLALTLFLGGWYFLLRRHLTMLKTWRTWSWDLVGVLLIFMAVFTYNTPLLLLPLLIPLLVWWRGVKQPAQWSFPVLGLILVAVVGFTSLLSLSKQKSGITIFSDESVWLQSVEYHQRFTGLTQKILGNRVVFYGQIMARNYFNTLAPQFLVTRGGAHPWHTLPGFGHLSWLVYALGLVGLGEAVWVSWHQRQKLFKHLHPYTFTVLLFLISPLPAITTVDAPHATRSLLFFWSWVVLAGIGLQYFLTTVHQRWPKLPLSIVTMVALIILSVESGKYFYVYFTQYPRTSVAILQGNFAPALNTVDTQFSTEKVAIIDEGGFQYILAAWYLKLTPEVFFNTIQRHLPDRIGFRYGYRLKNYRFIVSPNDRFPDEVVLVQWNKEKNLWQVQTVK